MSQIEENDFVCKINEEMFLPRHGDLLCQFNHEYYGIVHSMDMKEETFLEVYSNSSFLEASSEIERDFSFANADLKKYEKELERGKF
ncbi:MAG: hypothetical protein RR400_01865 [Clostridia bacterium]